MVGKVADMSNLETVKTNSIELSIYFAPKNFNDLPIGLDMIEKEDDTSTHVFLEVNENVLRSNTITESKSVMDTERDFIHNTRDLGPAAYHSPFSSGKQSKQETPQGNSFFWLFGG
ncbi:hypothetical protein V6N13_121363 [Hibiscus sabdariffa]|uniref:Uncharacterized protein n=2 Tax=Hibiscus sabdariffa TaxID=183260 RepID=A0ABR2A2B3_9ROSI